MRAALRWCGAVAVGVAAFEGLDLAASRVPILSWLTLASPFVAGAGGARAAGPGSVAPPPRAPPAARARLRGARSARAPAGVCVGDPLQVAERVVIGIEANPFLPLRDRILRVLSVRVDIAQVAVVDGIARFLPGDLPQLLQRRVMVVFGEPRGKRQFIARQQ